MDPYQRGRGEPKLARDEARAASAAGTKPECLRLALVPAVRVVSPEEAPSVVAYTRGVIDGTWGETLDGHDGAPRAHLAGSPPPKPAIA